MRLGKILLCVTLPLVEIYFRDSPKDLLNTVFKGLSDNRCSKGKIPADTFIGKKIVHENVRLGLFSGTC